MPDPISIPVPTSPKQIWAAKQHDASGISTLLLLNQDPVNTVKVGTSLTSVVVPVPPNGSLSVDPGSNWYLQGPVAGIAPLVVVPNGQGNFRGLTQGLGALAIPAMFSPNFVHLVSGWSIGIDGSAEFNNLTIRGTFFGTNFIINSLGIFIYSGVPALGNLVGSWCPVAVANDGFGNAALKDLTIYNPGTGGYVNTNSNAAAGGNAGILFNAPGATQATGKTQVSGRATNPGAANEVEILQLTSGIAGGTLSADISLFSKSADGTVVEQIIQALGGVAVTTLLPTQWNISVPISCTLGTPSTPSIITNGGFTRIASPFSNGWVNGGGGTDANGIIYRMLNNGSYEVWFDIINPGAQVNSIVTNLPAPFRPQKNFKHEWAGSLANSPWVQFNTNGDVIAVGNTAANAEINGRAEIPVIAIP